MLERIKDLEISIRYSEKYINKLKGDMDDDNLDSIEREDIHEVLDEQEKELLYYKNQLKIIQTSLKKPGA